MNLRPAKTFKAWAVYMPSGRLFCCKVDRTAAMNCLLNHSHSNPLETWNDYAFNGWTIEEVEVTPTRLLPKRKP